MMFLASGIVGALIQGGVVRRLVKQGAEQFVIGIGLLLSAAGFFLLLYSSSVVTAAIYLSVFGAGNALIRPCVTSLITQRTKVGQGVATGPQLLHGQPGPHRRPTPWRSGVRDRAFAAVHYRRRALLSSDFAAAALHFG